MNETHGQSTQSDTQPEELSVEQLRARYWADLMPLLADLDDWDLSLLGLLTYWSGYQAPGTPVRKSWKTIRPRIGSRRAGGTRLADRHALEGSAKRLQQLGLIERRENGTSWQLIFPRPAATAPTWPSFAAFNHRLWSREFKGAMQIRAGISRLSYQLDAEGRWRGSPGALADVLGVKSPQTARKRAEEISEAEKALIVEQGWDDAGCAVISVSCDFKPPAAAEDLNVELRRLSNELWYPELMDEIVAAAEALTKRGTITLSRKVKGFYKPVVSLQEKYGNPPLVKYALEQTLSSSVFKGQKGQHDTRRWHHYALQVCENNKWKFPRAADGDVEIVRPQRNNQTEQKPEAGKVASPQEAQSLRDRELAVRELLTQAAWLNGTGKTAEAREILLEQIAPQAKALAPLFANDLHRCKVALMLAFKQADTDFVGAKPADPATNPPDYYPEWPPAK